MLGDEKMKREIDKVIAARPGIPIKPKKEETQ
jgi:hypothetical protein